MVLPKFLVFCSLIALCFAAPNSRLQAQKQQLRRTNKALLEALKASLADTEKAVGQIDIRQSHYSGVDYGKHSREDYENKRSKYKVGEPGGTCPRGKMIYDINKCRSAANSYTYQDMLLVGGDRMTEIEGGCSLDVNRKQIRFNPYLEVRQESSSVRPVCYKLMRWKDCSSEGEWCTCDGWVRFGMESKGWSDIRRVSSKVDCSVTMFGDPNPSVDKKCQCFTSHSSF